MNIKNAIVLVEQIDLEAKMGKKPLDAVAVSYTHLFPIVVTTVVALFVPSAVPLIGMLMFGNLVKEIKYFASLNLISKDDVMHLKEELIQLLGVVRCV